MTTPPYHCLQRTVTAADLDRARTSVAPFAAAVQNAKDKAGRDATVLAWISDIHLHAPRGYDKPVSIYGEHVDSSANLRIAMAEITTLNPDLVIFGGDLADSGCPGEAPADEYEEMKRIFDDCLPDSIASLPLLGNHDHGDKPLTAPWHEAFTVNSRPDWPTSAGDEDFFYETMRNGWRFIALDSRQNHPITDAQHAWLTDRLSADTTTPTVLLVHRPYLSVGNWVDHHQFKDRRSFDVIDHAPAIKAVLSGHTHKSAAWTYRDKTHAIFPSSAYGIPDPCGWGVVVLGQSHVQDVLIKNLATTTYDSVAHQPQQNDGTFFTLDRPDYQTHPLHDPCRMPRPKPRA